MSNKPLLLTAGLVASLVLYTNCLLAQNTSSSSSSTPPPPPPPPPPPAVSTAAQPAAKVDLPPPSDKKGLTFDKDILPMVKASCSQCHGDTKPRSGYSVMTATSILKDAKGKVRVIPGDSAKSPIVLYVASTGKTAMPPISARDKNPPLTKEQIGILRAWIDQGAK